MPGPGSSPVAARHDVPQYEPHQNSIFFRINVVSGAYAHLGKALRAIKRSGRPVRSPHLQVNLRHPRPTSRSREFVQKLSSDPLPLDPRIGCNRLQFSLGGARSPITNPLISPSVGSSATKAIRRGLVGSSAASYAERGH